MLLSTLRRDMLSDTSNPPFMPLLQSNPSLHMLPQLPTPMPLMVCQSTTPTLVFTILANVKPKLTPNTSTVTEFTTLESTLTDTTDMPSQRSTAPLPPQSTLDTTEYTTESTTPTLESTILASVRLKLTLNLSTTLMLDTHTLLDTLVTPDTLV